MSQSWLERNAALADEITADLRAGYPNLHLFVAAKDEAEIRGTFPVRSAQGHTLDRYQISIQIPPGYPKELPVVRETGGRLPWKADFHVNHDGTCCVLLPEDRVNCFPVGARFRDFLDGPLRNFFLGQSLVALGEPWPFGQWSHGDEGVYEFYGELIGTPDRPVIREFLRVLTKLNPKPNWPCPCGSGKKSKKCCSTKIAALRQKIPPAIARKSAAQLGVITLPCVSEPSQQPH